MPYKNREDRLACQRRNYAKNAEKVRLGVQTHKKSKKQEWVEYKKTLSCIKCGQTHPAALDFHHVVRSKDNNKVHKLLRNGAYLAIWDEIKKCVVLCANCHRIHHFDEHNEKKDKERRKKKKGSP